MFPLFSILSYIGKVNAEHHEWKRGAGFVADLCDRCEALRPHGLKNRRLLRLFGVLTEGSERRIVWRKKCKVCGASSRADVCLYHGTLARYDIDLDELVRHTNSLANRIAMNGRDRAVLLSDGGYAARSLFMDAEKRPKRFTMRGDAKLVWRLVIGLVLAQVIAVAIAAMHIRAIHGQSTMSPYILLTPLPVVISAVVAWWYSKFKVPKNFARSIADEMYIAGATLSDLKRAYRWAETFDLTVSRKTRLGQLTSEYESLISLAASSE